LGKVHALRDLTVKVTRPNGDTREYTKKAGDLVAFIFGSFYVGTWKFDSDEEAIKITWTGTDWERLDVKKKDVMRSIHPSRWGITGRQLNELADKVVKKFTGARANPNVYHVVDEIIKPACLARHVSYAILLNPGGKECCTFVSHAWFESFLKFVEDIRLYYADFETRVFWICFAANPQTWPDDRLQMLLGYTATQSPFAIAMEKCKSMLVVRNTTRNMYSRLWCVTELALVEAYAKKPVHVIGAMPPHAAESRSNIGRGADCSGPEKDMLLSTIAHAEAHAEMDIEELVAKVISAKSGSVLRPRSTCLCICQ